MQGVTVTLCLWEGTRSATLSDGNAPLLGLTPAVTMEHPGHPLPHHVSPWPQDLTSFTCAPRRPAADPGTDLVLF